jgi:hypothetical protein
METNMRFIRTLAVTALVAVAGAGCADLEVTNLNNPDRARAISTPSDVEALVSGAFQTWWGATHYSYPSSALSTGADAHSSSWGNWGMRDWGWEPRKQFDNSPSYSYRWVAQTPWGDYYTAIAAANDGLKAIADGIEIGDGGEDTQRTIFFAKLIQGISHGYLAILFDKAWVVDETTDLATLDADAFQDYNAVWAVAKAKLQEAIDIASANDFTIPSAWVSYGGDWSTTEAIQFIRGYRARMESQMPRTPAERDAAPWAQILADAQAGIQEGNDFGSQYDSNTWGWMRQKLHTAGIAGWARIDYRTVGPADTSGEYAAWLATSNPELRTPFNIQTTDSRITGQTDTDGDGETYDENGSLITYLGNSPFPASRGTYHYSNYISDHWTYLSDASGYYGFYPDLTYKEMEFLMAEAYMRGQGGGPAAAMPIVNKYRAMGGLPAFTDPAGVAPGGADCIPRNDGVNCASLLEAMKYEKRIELFHHGLGTEYFDDRGWGDLVPGTALQLPVPGSELELLLADIYTFGGSAGSAAPNLVNSITPASLKLKREAIERYQKAREDIEVGIGH